MFHSFIFRFARPIALEVINVDDEYLVRIVVAMKELNNHLPLP